MINDEGYTFGTSWFNGSTKSNTTIEAYMTAVNPIAMPGVKPPDEIPLGYGAKMLFLAASCRLFTDPTTDVPDCTAGNRATGCCSPNEENDKSTAVLITYGDYEFLWAGSTPARR